MLATFRTGVRYSATPKAVPFTVLTKLCMAFFENIDVLRLPEINKPESETVVSQNVAKSKRPQVKTSPKLFCAPPPLYYFIIYFHGTALNQWLIIKKDKSDQSLIQHPAPVYSLYPKHHEHNKTLFKDSHCSNRWTYLYLCVNLCSNSWDIVMGNESWLNPDIKKSNFFPWLF